MSAKEFAILSLGIVGCSNIHTMTMHKRFHSEFGIPPRLAAMLWKDVAQHGCLDYLGPRSPKPVHNVMLWLLHWLKCYNKESTNAAKCKTTQKTF